MLLGWAGWDHAQQALALILIMGERESEGAPESTLLPLAAGVAELQPWVRQWHDMTDPMTGANLAEFVGEQLRDRATQLGVTMEDLAAWRPPASRRGRRKKA